MDLLESKLNSNQKGYFFKTTRKNDNYKKIISSPKEYEFIKYLEELGFKENIDFKHQFPCAQEQMGLVYVADFCFPKEMLIIELDGKSHNSKKQRMRDGMRDYVFRTNKYSIVRIKTPMTNYDKSFYKNIIKDFIKEKRYEEPELD